jgi:glycosyltransferase involved in cell wall biosynthesis
MQPVLHQVNLSGSLGGAEVYTRSFTDALIARGWRTRVYTRSDARFWSELRLPAAVAVPIEDPADLPAALPERSFVVVHAPVPRPVLEALRPRVRLVGVAHQALYDESRPAYYELAHVLLAVSRHVADTLRRNGLTCIHGDPLYAVADPGHSEGAPRDRRAGEITRGPLCDWDGRKLRDRLAALAEPLVARLRPARAFRRRPGVTLGIVSRIAPLKQFPALFAEIAGAIVRQPAVTVEVFGSAVGYRALRDFRRAVRPLGGQVRLWGHQSDVAAVYRSIDFLLTGLPEREALGLNVLEAQVCGTPVLAPRAPPFTETVVDGVTGFLFTDPREDRGREFGALLDRLVATGLRPDPRTAREHLARFSFDAFADRVAAAMRALTETGLAAAAR